MADNLTRELAELLDELGLVTISNDLLDALLEHEGETYRFAMELLELQARGLVDVELGQDGEPRFTPAATAVRRDEEQPC